MNYTLRQLSAFQAIDTHRNITRAAQELGLTQSGLSALLRELEAEAGATLFHRTTRRVEPTAAGEVFRPLAQQVLQDAGSLAKEFRSYRLGERGRIRLGLLPSLAAVLLPDLMREFRDSHPLVEIDLVEAHAGVLLDMVSVGTLPIALGTAFGRTPGIRQENVGQDEIVAILQSGESSDSSKPLKWRDLAAIGFIAIKDSASLRVLSDAGFRVSGAVPQSMIEVGSMTTAVAFVRAGFGCTILPHSALAMIVTDGLEVRRLNEPNLSRDISMITPFRQNNPAATAFRELVLRSVGTATGLFPRG